MNITEQQIEWIVQEVIRRLQDSLPESSKNGQSTAECGKSLQLKETLVTTETLHNRLAGVNTLRVARRAIVTPAVVDLLKDRKIQLLRESK